MSLRSVGWFVGISLLVACSKDSPRSDPAPAASPVAAPAASAAVRAAVGAQIGDCAVTTQPAKGISNVATVVSSMHPRLRAVYNRGLQMDAKQAGTFTFTAQIDEHGAVTNVDATAVGLSKDVVGALSSILKGAQFDVGGKPTTLSGSIECMPIK